MWKFSNQRPQNLTHVHLFFMVVSFSISSRVLHGIFQKFEMYDRLKGSLPKKEFQIGNYPNLLGPPPPP